MADEADRPFGGHFKIPDDFQQFCSLHAAFSVEGESSAACQEFLQRLVTLHPPARDPALVADIMHVRHRSRVPGRVIATRTSQAMRVGLLGLVRPVLWC